MKFKTYLLSLCLFFISISILYPQGFKIKVPKINTNVPTGTTQSTDKLLQGGTYNAGEVVDVWDPIEKGWFSANILKTQDRKYFVHFTNYDPKWDTWVTVERIRPAGKGNKNDPGPAVPSNTNTSTSNPVKNISNNVNTTASNTSYNPKEGSYPVSEKAGPTSFPVIYPKDKLLTFRIGDPVIFELNGKKEVYTIADLYYSSDFKKMGSFNDQEMIINLSKVELVSGYNYTHFPETITNGSGDKFKEGDLVEVLCFKNEYSVKYKWEKGIVVSVDGDNYYIYRPGTSDRPENEYYWHFISEMRAIGTNKSVVMPPEYGDQNKNPNLSTYYKALKSAECDGHNNWEFLWYYRHDFGTFNPRLIVYADKFKEMLNQYNCINDTRKDYPDIGISGYTIQSRFDIQWEFLQKRNDYIKKGLERAALANFNSFTLKVKDAYYEHDMAYIDGLEEIKKKAKGDRTKNLDNCATLIGMTLDYPWAQLESAYNEGLQKFMSEKTVEYKGLEYDGTSYKGKDAKAEAIAKKYVLDLFPGSKIMASGTGGDFYINKEDNGIPRNRAKGIVVIHSNPKYRTCIMTYCFYQEDYAGGGSYGAGFINGQLTGNRYLKTCK